MSVSTVSPVFSTQSTTVRYAYQITDFKSNVRLGQQIQPGDPIAVRRVHSTVSVINFGRQLGRGARLTDREFLPGSTITEGTVVADAAGPFGLGRKQAVSPVSGIVQAFIEDAGILIVRPDSHEENITAHFAAVVVEISPDKIEVEVRGAPVRAMIGSGAPVAGSLAVIDNSGSMSDALRSIIDVGDNTPPRILAFQCPIDTKIVRLVREAFWQPDPIAIIGPSVQYGEFAELGASFSGISFLAIEGYGSGSFRSTDLDPVWRGIVASRGRHAVVIPDAEGSPVLLLLSATSGAAMESPPSSLRPGLAVRFLDGFDITHGVIVEVPEEPRRLSSGFKAKVALVAAEDRAIRLVPQDNIEVLASEGQGS